MKIPKITVITATYNRAHTLSRTYESLKKQTYKEFHWIVMDDGSTDETRMLVQKFIDENEISIEYHFNENSKKFFTVFRGIEKVRTKYFCILDSDDAYVEDGLGKMVKVMDKLNEDEFISATFNSQYPDGRLVGTPFPHNFEGSILEMRYKHKVKGDKHSVFFTDKYKSYLENFDYSLYKHKYAPQKIFFNIYDAKGEKSKFENQMVRIYYYNEADGASMSNERVKPSSYFGMLKGYESFLNSYGVQLFNYPVTLVRSIIGFQLYAIKSSWSLRKIITGIKNPVTGIIALFILPFSFVYSLFRI